MRWKAIFRAARGELRAGIRGFRLFVLCIAIGAAAIAASGSVAASFRAGLAAQSRAILGGDLSFELTQKWPSADMRAWLEARGETSLTLEANAMASGPKARKLAQVRAIDGAHPLEGVVTLKSGETLQQALQPRGSLPAIVAEQALLSQIGANVGDRIEIAGGAAFVAGIIDKEPDAIGRGFAFAPRLLMRLEDIRALGLGSEGSLYKTEMHIALPPGAGVDGAKAELERRFPELKDRVRTRDNAARGLKATITRLETFLGFVGLATLLAGGLGVQGAVQAYVASRRPQIAALKALGASSADIGAIVGLNVAAVSALGITLGLCLGAAAPFIAVALAGDALPIPVVAGFSPAALGAAATLSTIAAFAFAIGPIGSARITPPALLFRGGAGSTDVPAPERIASWAGLLCLAGIAALFSKAPLYAASLALAAFAMFGVLRVLGSGVQALAKRIRPQMRGMLNLAMAGLGGRGSLAPATAPAIGLGAALLVFLTQIQTNLVTQVSQTAPQRFATGIYLEVPPGEGPAFDQIAVDVVGQKLRPNWFQRAPVLTARVIGLNGAEIGPESVKESERWIVESDISASFLNTQPSTFEILSGSWWPDNYAGPPLVSIEDDAARGIKAKVGDVLLFEAAGREIEVTIANLRKVKFDEMGPNFALIFSPGIFEAANPRSFAMVRLDDRLQKKLETAISEHFPTVVILRIRDALEAAAKLFESLTLAINSVSGIALAAGALAVAGAIAAGAQRRIYDAAILKTLGFTRWQIIAALAIELGLVGAITAALGALIGFAGAYPIVVNVIEAQWSPAIGPALIVIAGSVLSLGIAGAAIGYLALKPPPARVLKASA